MLIAVSQMDSLIEELERSYADAQERMSDPAIFSDHHQAADAGRRLKELEGPHKLAQEWRSTHDDLEAARGDSELRGLVPECDLRRWSFAVLETEFRDLTVPTLVTRAGERRAAGATA